MSEPKFTPGPWAVFDTHPDRACFYIDSHDHNAERAVGEVAVIYTTTDDTKRANAQLIAAAPDLCAVAARIVEIAAKPRASIAEWDAAFDAARAALAKAVGK